MHRKGLLFITAISVVGVLVGCQTEQTRGAGLENKGYAEPKQTAEQGWNVVEWGDIVLQLPETTDRDYSSTAFKTADPTSEWSDLELIVHRWEGSWPQGNYSMEQYEVTMDKEVSPLVNVPLADQFIEEYRSEQEAAGYTNADDRKTAISLGDRTVWETEVRNGPDQYVQQTWEYVKDPYSRWRLSVSVQKEFAKNALDTVRHSFRLKEVPETFAAGQAIALGDMEIQIPCTLDLTTANEQFSEVWDDSGNEYCYTVQIWEGEVDRTSCLLRHYSVSSSEDTLSSYFTPSHTWTYSSHPDFGMEAEKKRTEQRTYTDGDCFVVWEGTYPKVIDRSYGYQNDDGRAIRTWFYVQNPYEVWYLEIITPKAQAEALFQEVETSIKHKREYES